MFEHSHQLRIHYALTDQMGVVYHGNYAQFFEIARVEAIRKMGYTYKQVEEMGIIMPVFELNTRFIRPIRYDELITIKVTIKEMPLSYRFVFHGEIYNEKNEICTTGIVTLYIIDTKTGKKVELPEVLKTALLPYFSEGEATDKA